MNQYRDLPVPSANGVGATVDVSTLAASKTITLQGDLHGSVTIEYSVDGATWAPAYTFGKTGKRVLEVVAGFMRARVSNYSWGSANCDVGAEQALVNTVELVAPAGNGSGAAVDVSALDELNTVVVGGSFSGSAVIEISEDNVAWVPAISFAWPGGGKTKRMVAQFMRVTRQNVNLSAPGLPTVFVAAASGAGGGLASNVIAGNSDLNPVNVVIYVRTTGSDESGNGTLATPYRTLRRALRDVPQFIFHNSTYTIDITGITETLRQEGPGLYSSYYISGYQGNPWGDVDYTKEAWERNTLALTIRAEPELVDTIEPGDVVSDTADPVTGFRTLVTTKAFPDPDGYKGLMVMGPAGTWTSGVIRTNDATTINVMESGALDFPLKVVRPGATLQADPANNVYNALGINGCNAGLHLSGIAFENDGGYSCALTVEHGGYLSITLCSIEGFDVGDLAYIGLSASLITRGGTERMGNKSHLIAVTNCFFLGCYFDDTSPRAPEGNYQVFSSCYEGCNTIGTGPNVGYNDSCGGGQFSFGNLLIDGSTGDGIQYRGGAQSAILDTVIQNCNGDAIQCDNGNRLYLKQVTGSGNTGYGVRIQHGSVVQRANGGLGVVVTGALGDYIVGANPAGTWAGYASPEHDLAQPASQICRMYT